MTLHRSFFRSAIHSVREKSDIEQLSKVFDHLTDIFMSAVMELCRLNFSFDVVFQQAFFCRKIFWKSNIRVSMYMKTERKCFPFMFHSHFPGLKKKSNSTIPSMLRELSDSGRAPSEFWRGREPVWVEVWPPGVATRCARTVTNDQQYWCFRLFTARRRYRCRTLKTLWPRCGASWIGRSSFKTSCGPSR